jgi:hypothetical protein
MKMRNKKAAMIKIRKRKNKRKNPVLNLKKKSLKMKTVRKTNQSLLKMINTIQIENKDIY